MRKHLWWNSRSDHVAARNALIFGARSVQRPAPFPGLHRSTFTRRRWSCASSRSSRIARTTASIFPAQPGPRRAISSATGRTALGFTLGRRRLDRLVTSSKPASHANRRPPRLATRNGLWHLGNAACGFIAATRRQFVITRLSALLRHAEPHTAENGDGPSPKVIRATIIERRAIGNCIAIDRDIVNDRNFIRQYLKTLRVRPPPAP